MDHNCFSQIPKMDKLLERPALQWAHTAYPRTMIREAVQAVVAQLQQELRQGGQMPSMEELDARMVQSVERAGRFSLCRLVNATGIVLHTNLGRAPLGVENAEHMAAMASHYSNLEFNLEEGRRGSRYDHVERLLCRLTGAEAALIVNNNAAAVFLMLNTLANGKTVAVSRGELVEIGGSFRIPEIMEQSGAQLLEIGTTNKTRLSDYRNAIEEKGAGALLKVHSSNFKICGFTEQAEPEQLAALAREHDLPLLYDLGAGFLVPPRMVGVQDGIDVKDAVASADVVCFSGDKLLGAGQAGILVGRRALIDRMKKNQLLRMLRIDKLSLASIEGVLRWYLDPAQAIQKVPVLRMLAEREETLQSRARQLAQRLNETVKTMSFEAVPCMDEPGGGTMPTLELPGWAVAVSSGNRSAQVLTEWLRDRETPVIGRIHHGMLLLSVRTLLEGDDDAIVAAFAALEGLQ